MIMVGDCARWWRWAVPGWITIGMALIVLFTGGGSLGARLGHHGILAGLVLLFGSLWSIPRHWVLCKGSGVPDDARQAIRQRGWLLAKIGSVALVVGVFGWPGPRSFSSGYGFVLWILGFFGFVLVVRGVTAGFWPPKRNPYR